MDEPKAVNVGDRLPHRSSGFLDRFLFRRSCQELDGVDGPLNVDGAESRSPQEAFLGGHDKRGLSHGCALSPKLGGEPDFPT